MCTDFDYNAFDFHARPQEGWGPTMWYRRGDMMPQEAAVKYKAATMWQINWGVNLCDII